MLFFREKPLCFMILVVLCGFSLFSFCNLPLSIVLSCVFALALLSYLLYRIIKRAGVAYPIVLFLLFAISVTLSYFYFVFARRVEASSALVRGEVSEIYESSYGMRFALSCESIDEKEVWQAKIMVYCSDEPEFELKEGDTIEVSLELLPYYSDTSSSSLYYFSQGFTASADVISDITVIDHVDHPLRGLIRSIKDAFHSHIISNFGDNGGGLFLALIIGDKSKLNSDCNLDFTRIGISHILALSGQHLAILSLLIHKLLSLLGINKKWRLGILSIIAALYVVLTGFSPSVTRAALMLILGAIYFLLGKPHDLSTALFISVFLFVLVQPYAITDVSLLLSALATFGIIHALSVVPEKKKGALWQILHPVALSLVMSFFAMLYTVTLTVSRFSYFSVLSPLSTFVFSILIEVYIYIGLVLSLVSILFPVIPVSEFLYEVIHTPAHFLSSLDFVYFSSDFLLCQILSVILAIALVCYLIFSFKRKRLAFWGICFIFASVYICGAVGTGMSLYDDDILYMSTSTDEQILMKDEGEVTLIDFDPSTTSAMYRTLERMQQNHLGCIDTYILSGLRPSLVQSMEALLSGIKIKRIILPTPKNAEEVQIYNELVVLLEHMNVEYSPLDEQSKITLSTSQIYLFERGEYGEGYSAILAIYQDDTYYTYVAKGAINEENVDLTNALLNESTSVIFGLKGKSSKLYREIGYLSDNIKLLILSNDTIQLERTLLENLEEKEAIVIHPQQHSLIVTN